MESTPIKTTMEKLQKLLMLFFMATLALTFSSCGDDDGDEPAPKPQFGDISGYWYSEDDGEFLAYYLYPIQEYYVIPEADCTVMKGIVGNRNSRDARVSTYNYEQVDGMTIIRATSNTLVLDEHGDGSDLIELRRISSTEWDNLIDTATLDGDEPKPDEPDTPDNPQYSPLNFVGHWYYPTKTAVFDIKSSGVIDCYILSGYEAETYTDLITGTWSYEVSSAILNINLPKGYSRTLKVSYVELPYGFKTDYGNFDVCSKLPSPESSVSENPLEGTNWEGNVDDCYVVLQFKADGTFVEQFDGEKHNSKYQVMDSNTLLIEENTVLSNTFGSIVNFKLNSNKTALSLYDSYEEWKFTRKM